MIFENVWWVSHQGGGNSLRDTSRHSPSVQKQRTLYCPSNRVLTVCATYFCTCSHVRYEALSVQLYGRCRTLFRCRFCVHACRGQLCAPAAYRRHSGTTVDTHLILCVHYIPCCIEPYSMYVLSVHQAATHMITGVVHILRFRQTLFSPGKLCFSRRHGQTNHLSGRTPDLGEIFSKKRKKMKGVREKRVSGTLSEETGNRFPTVLALIMRSHPSVSTSVRRVLAE